MGFFDKIKNNLSGDSKKSKENSGSGSKRNFQYLNNLIHSGQKEIFLDNDIILDTSFRNKEHDTFGYGLLLNVDDMVIDGNGYAIDAKNKVRIFQCLGKNITFKNITFKNGFSKMGNGGALLANDKDYNLKFINCNFINNSSNNDGGAIFNVGEITFENCKFTNNSVKNAGGAIATAEGSIINIIDTDFEDNSSNNGGGAIGSFGEVYLNNCNFYNNSAKNVGGAFNNQKSGVLTAINVEFINNRANLDAGAILNLGKCSLEDCKFSRNSSKQYGDVISNQPLAVLSINNGDFMDHDVNFAILFNQGVANLNGGIFKDNYSKKADCLILSYPGSSLSCSNYQFIENRYSKGTCINNSSDGAKFIKCSFCNNKNNSVIFNKSSLDLIDCIFYENKSNFYIIDSFDEESALNLLGGKLISNKAKTTLYNSGKSCTVDKTIFKSNSSIVGSFDDIYNESYLNLQSPKFESNGKTVLNNGQLDVRKFSKEDVECSVENLGNVDYYDAPSVVTPKVIETQDKENDYSDVLPAENDDMLLNFSYLDNLIHLTNFDDGVEDLGAKLETIVDSESKKVLISLKSGIRLENYERDFYEGGIDLDIDNLIIDGNNNILDGNLKSRIFNVSGKNIVLKNIIFKNAKVFVGYSQQEHLDGGGAIKLVKGASLTLIDCEFIENSSDDNGGALLNNGELTSVNCYFNNNESECYAGAIYNNGLIHIKNNEFNGNESKFAGAIYNLGSLTIDDIILKDNMSNISQPIYNANLINFTSGLNIENEIYNSSNVNPNSSEYESFSYFANQIKGSNSVILQKDIVFDYEIDYKLKNGIDIDNDVIIEGNGHAIDGDDISSFFNVNARVTFKDVTFKNGFSQDNAIINNNSQISFENCKFLNNRITSKTNFLINNGSLNLLNCSFYNNSSSNVLLLNRGNLELDKVLFVNNNIYAYKGIIGNERFNKVNISNSIFKYNTSRRELILNETGATLLIQDFEFEYNESKTLGLIENSGRANFNGGVFNNNTSKSAGVIDNKDQGILNMDNVDFNQNFSETCGGIVNSGNINLNNCDFTENTAKSKLGSGAIFSPYGKIKLRNCNFKDNDPAKNVLKNRG